MHPRVSCVLTLRERSSDACSATAEAPGQGRSARAPPIARAEAHATRACRCGAGVGGLYRGYRGRRPPAPWRIDLYAPMARFLRLHRNDLPTCARVERSAEPAARRRPDPGVWKLLVELCEPKKARLLARQLAKPEGGALEHLIVGRLLEVAQGFVNRRLEDEVGMRVAATREGRSYLDMRMRLLEFLDSSPESITVADCEDFVRNRIVFWDIDLETRAMRIVLR